MTDKKSKKDKVAEAYARGVVDGRIDASQEVVDLEEYYKKLTDDVSAERYNRGYEVGYVEGVDDENKQGYIRLSEKCQQSYDDGFNHGVNVTLGSDFDDECDAEIVARKRRSHTITKWLLVFIISSIIITIIGTIDVAVISTTAEHFNMPVLRYAGFGCIIILWVVSMCITGNLIENKMKTELGEMYE